VSLEEIKALSARLAELCRKYGIAELAVFGWPTRRSCMRREELYLADLGRLGSCLEDRPGRTGSP